MEEKEVKYNKEVEDVSVKDLVSKIRSFARYLQLQWILRVILAVIDGTLRLNYASYKKPVYLATTTFVLETVVLAVMGLTIQRTTNSIIA